MCRSELFFFGLVFVCLLIEQNVPHFHISFQANLLPTPASHLICLHTIVLFIDRAGTLILFGPSMAFHPCPLLLHHPLNKRLHNNNNLRPLERLQPLQQTPHPRMESW